MAVDFPISILALTIERVHSRHSIVSQNLNVLPRMHFSIEYVSNTKLNKCNIVVVVVAYLGNDLCHNSSLKYD